MPDDITITVADAKSSAPSSISWEDFASLAKGSSIHGVSRSDDRLRIETSNGLSIEVAISPANAINIAFRPQPEEFAPARIVLIDDAETPTAALIEHRLWHVRQLYALLFLLRVPAIGDVDHPIGVAALSLSTDQESDLEEIVPLELQVRSAGTGSFWLEFFISPQNNAAMLQTGAHILSNAHSALLALSSICTICAEGWWLVRFLAARSAAGKTADVEHTRTQVESETIRFNALLDHLEQIDKLDEPEERKEALRRRLLRNISGIFGARSQGLLPPKFPPPQKR